MPATVNRRPTSEVVAALVTAVTGVVWQPPQGAPVAAFDRVERFDSEQLAEAFKFLLVTEQRVCVVVPLDERFEDALESGPRGGRKLVITRLLPVAILVSDRVLGDRQSAVWGKLDGAVAADWTPGAMGLAELVLPAVTGLLLPNPAGVKCVPQSVSVMAVRDTEKSLPSRVAVSVEVECRGGQLEAVLGAGPIL